MATFEFEFGAKLAKYVEFYERKPKTPGQKQKLPDHQVFNNALSRAEAAGESPSVDLFNRIGKEHDEQKKQEEKESAAYKFGKSMCYTPDMSKHDKSKYQTGPMRALAAEEAVKPADGGVTETEETEHAEKNITNSGQKESAHKKAVDLKKLFGGIARSMPGRSANAATSAAQAQKLFNQGAAATRAGTAAPKVTITPQDVAGAAPAAATAKPSLLGKLFGTGNTTGGVNNSRWTGHLDAAAAGEAADIAALRNAAPSAGTAAPKVKLTPQEMAEMRRLNEAGRGYSLPQQRAATPVAARAAQQNARAATQARLEAGGGTAEDIQQVMGPTFKEYDARVAGAGRTPPAVPSKPTTPQTPQAATPAVSSAPTAPTRGTTTLPTSVKPGATLNHKQFGQGRVTNISNGVATVQFPGQPPRQYRVSGGSSAAPAKPATPPTTGPKPPAPKPPAPKTPAAATPAAAPAAAPVRKPSMADRAFSATRSYGNATGMLPTSVGGLAMAGINPMLQNNVAPVVDNAYGTNFSGRDKNRTDLSTRAGQFMFPTQRAWNAVANQPVFNGTSPRQFGQQLLERGVNALPGGR